MPRLWRNAIVLTFVYGLCGLQFYLHSARSTRRRILFNDESLSVISRLPQMLDHHAGDQTPPKIADDDSLPSGILYIPEDGPDVSMTQKVISAFAHQKNVTGSKLLQRQLSTHGITCQVRLLMPHDSDRPWTLQTLDEHGQPKLLGGDEFYITFTSSRHRHKDKLWEDEPDHPTAVAMITDERNGIYTLDFVRSPMTTDSDKDDYTLTSGDLTIHFVYSSGIGEMAPPSKDGWKHGGAIQKSFTVSVPHGPRIRAFTPPPPTVDLGDYDHVLLVGDSVMGQFCGHNGVKFRSHVTREQRTAALNTETMQSFVDKTMGAARQLVQHNSSIVKLAVILGSSTWDILADSLGQGADFADHGQAVRSLISTVRRELHKLDLPVSPTIMWKSPTAVHAHVVIDKRTKYFGTPVMARKRIKYMSTFRSSTLYEVQQRIMQEMHVPFLDVYQASLLSGDWHYPTDGRHFRPEFNHMIFNWFYSTDEQVEIDYRFDGYGVAFPEADTKPQ